MSAKKRIQEGLGRLEEVPRPPAEQADADSALPEITLEAGLSLSCTKLEPGIDRWDVWPLVDATSPVLQELAEPQDELFSRMLLSFDGMNPAVVAEMRQLPRRRRTRPQYTRFADGGV